MVKDKIIELDNGVSYYILEELSHNDKKYILAAECDLEKDEINTEDYLIIEIAIEGENLVTKKIEDEVIAQEITKLLIEKARAE